MLNPQYTIILGDFNNNVINNNGQDANTSDLYAKLNCFLAGNGLVQLIHEPTRVTNHSSTVLDLIITNSPGWFTNSGILSPPSNCDHSFIFGKIATTRRKAKSFCRTIRRFSNVDVQGLNQALKNNMDEQLAGGATDINETYNKWFEGFTRILDNYIPPQVVTIRPNHKPLMNSKICLAICKRDRLLHKHNRIKTVLSWQNYKRQRNLTTKLIRCGKVLFYEKANNSLCDPQLGPKNFPQIVW